MRSGFEVVGILGVGGSPSCGVWSNLDLRCSLEAVARCPIAQCDRRLVNEEAVAACLSEGEGLYIAAIQRQLRRKHITIKWYEHDLLAEIRGQPIHLQGKKESKAYPLYDR